MTRETMAAEDRVAAAVALESVDRCPVFPILVTAGPRLYGITQGEAWRNHDAAREAMIWCFREFGYDYGSKPNFYYPMLPGKLCGAPVRNLIPGRQLGEDDLYQIDERVLFPREDYDKIAALGWNGYWDEYYEKMSGKSLEKFTMMQTFSNRFYVEDQTICRDQGMPIFLGATVDSVLMAFSLSRTLTEFTRDLYEVPDKVEAAMKAACDDLIANGIGACRLNGNMMAFIVLERGSGYYYRMEVFERFEWPFLQRYVDAFVSEGILPVLHLDTDWGKNLPYFKALPKGKCLCDLDGTTDIFRAKEILKGHMCISGDVPAGLLSLGTPGDVEDYCRRLIDEIGDGGGFMLTTGCECPIDVKPENLRAMVETGKNYRGRKDRIQSTRSEQARRIVKPVDTSAALARAVAELRHGEVMVLVNQGLDEGREALSILKDCQVGMERVGELYHTGDYVLGELIMSADGFRKVLARLEPYLMAGRAEEPWGKVVIATPQGDIHDIGKDIAATFFKAGGFEVYDLGVDASPESIVEKTASTGAEIVAMSALITPTFKSMKAVTGLLKEKELRGDRYVIIGGGPTSPLVRDFVEADAWTLDPQEGVALCREFVKR